MNKKYVKTGRVSSEDKETIQNLLAWIDPNESVKFTYKENHYSVEISDNTLSCDNAEEEFKELIVESVY